MCKFKSALIAKYKDDIKLFWKFDEDSHSELSKLLEQEFGWPEEVCPIEVTCGKIVIDMEKTDQKPWMKEYVKDNKEQIQEIEKKTLEWMKTHKLDLIDITDSIGFVIPKGSKIERIFANNSKDLTLEGPIVADLLDVSRSKNLVIPKGSKIEKVFASFSKNLTFEGPIVAEELSVNYTEDFVIPKESKIKKVFARNSKNLTFEGPIVAEYLYASYTDGFVIPEGSIIEVINASYSKNITFEDDCEIKELYAEGSSGMSIPSTCKIGEKYV